MQDTAALRQLTASSSLLLKPDPKDGVREPLTDNLELHDREPERGRRSGQHRSLVLVRFPNEMHGSTMVRMPSGQSCLCWQWLFKLGALSRGT